MFLLTQKLEDSTFQKHAHHDTVAELWAALVLEFTNRSQMAQASMRSEFMGMRSKPGLDLHAEFDRLRSVHDDCIAAGVTISDSDYRATIINFAPSSLSTFISQISANAKVNAILLCTASKTSGSESTTATSVALEPEDMIAIILEESDRRKANTKCEKDSTPGVAAITQSSEKPGQRTGGKRRKGPRRPVGECWNCGDKGHKQDACPKPKKADSRDKGKANLPKPANQSPMPFANIAYDLEEVCGAWTVVSVSSPFGMRSSA